MTATLIYVSLANEDVEVRRPVQAERVGGDVYVILDQVYDRDTEQWQFEPGERVICETVTTSDGPVLAAVRAARSVERSPR